MKRQKIRKALIYISALLFPLTMFYYSPYILLHAATKGIICGSFILFGAMLLFSIFFGRLFCGYFCAGAALAKWPAALTKTRQSWDDDAISNTFYGSFGLCPFSFFT